MDLVIQSQIPYYEFHYFFPVTAIKQTDRKTNRHSVRQVGMTYRYNDSSRIQGTQRKSVNSYYKLSRQVAIQIVILRVPEIFLEVIEL